MKSIMQAKKECFVTKQAAGLHKHHIYGAANRNNSEKYGLWVWLILDLHTGNNGIHNGNKALDIELKKQAQRQFEKEHSREDFMRIFGRNYL